MNMSNLIPLHELPAMLPPRPNGRRISHSTIARWVREGIRGRRLRSLRVGGTRYVRRANFEAFIVEDVEDGTSTQVISRPSRSRSGLGPDLRRRHAEDELTLAAADW